MLSDLIVLSYAQAELAAGGRVLTSAQISALPSKIAEASSAVRRWCGDRDFSRQTYTEDHRAGHDGSVDLRQFPVNKVLRVSCGRTQAIAIGNSDQVGNVRASVGFTSTGDEATGITWTGLALVRTSGGIDSETDLSFATYPTLGVLAASVNALGSGWSATVPTSLASWPSGELVGGDVAQDALSGLASLEVFAGVLGGARVDRRTGVLSIGSGSASGYTSGGSGWGPGWSTDRDDWSGSGTGSGTVRVIYDAGFDTIPPPIQYATAIWAGKMLDDLGRDLAITSETAGRGSYTVDPNRSPSPPPEAMAAMLPYRAIRI